MEESGESAIAEKGTDALGWYQPYHRYEGTHWGIYLYLPRVLDLGRTLSDRLAEVGCAHPNLGFELATRLVVEHELFHARMETFALEREMDTERVLYKAYEESVYQQTVGKRAALEEALANYVAREEIRALMTVWIKEEKCRQEDVDAVLAFIDDFYDLVRLATEIGDLVRNPFRGVD